MKILQNFKNLHIFFVGIGGISMSGLAKLLHYNGAIVNGSDIGNSPEIDCLKQLGIQVHLCHSENNITKDIDIVVFTGAIKPDNSELKQAKKLNIRMMERSEFLGYIASNYHKVISISGTHGKTTTTAMIGYIFKCAKKNPTIHIGGESIDLKGNTILGSNEYFIVEACEYRKSFSFLHSDTAVITNIECDHLDFYKDLQDIEDSFLNFASNSNFLVKAKGINISHNNSISVGDNWLVTNIVFNDFGYDYDVLFNKELFGHFRLNMLGVHNVINSLFAIAVSHHYEIDKKIICNSLKNFHGVARRYEKIGVVGCDKNIPVIIDYAHHPTEIKNSYKGLLEVYKNILVVFQPHTYSRTIKLFDDFINTLNKIDNLILFKTYPAREKEIVGGRAIDIFSKLNSKNIEYFENLQDLISAINNKISFYKYDAVLILGAGDLAEFLRGVFESN